MEEKTKVFSSSNKGLLQSKELYQYILDTSVYPREPELLRELREVTATHPRAGMGTAPDSGQLMAILLKLLNAKRTIEIGVFTGYSLLLTALNIPEDGKIIAIDEDSAAYEMGLPIIKKAGVEHKIDFIESKALQALDKIVQKPDSEGSFDFAFVDADKVNYWNYHERLLKLVKVGGLAVYDNTLWGGSVAMPEDAVGHMLKEGRKLTIEFNNLLAKDARVQICHASIGDGMTICKRIS
ncbi:probable caffeoyl-CoA O-methyltransferase At4g26220 [Eucalyptus grandis]|uniref:probable caffeoyl-CoA O-methyltransferase At4g26220 n=1 Tax=Eucalyptus grandis TaxID=71139 RepID=UPI00192EE8A9|nr:probable caffeoyl-CoA O-methyltransferase At4g26220 [Eucalyptus grandis]